MKPNTLALALLAGATTANSHPGCVQQALNEWCSTRSPGAVARLRGHPPAFYCFAATL
ncbi:hypothetical protein T492DRAFT_886144, partial [Pavlovales sp. CCMP2436]